MQASVLLELLNITNTVDKRIIADLSTELILVFLLMVMHYNIMNWMPSNCNCFYIDYIKDLFFKKKKPWYFQNIFFNK